MALSAKAIRYLGAIGKLGKRVAPYTDEAAKYGRKVLSKVRRAPAQAELPFPKQGNVFTRGASKVEEFFRPKPPKVLDKWGRRAFRAEVAGGFLGGGLSLYGGYASVKDKKKKAKKEQENIDKAQAKRDQLLRRFEKSLTVKKVRRTK